MEMSLFILTELVCLLIGTYPIFNQWISKITICFYNFINKTNLQKKKK